MIDYFALLGEPRRPWLEAEALKQRFLTLSGEHHPDRTHQAGTEQKAQAQRRYADLNAAYQCLRDPKERLRHLLELERGGKLDQMQNVPTALMDVSLLVGAACRQADALLKEKSDVTSPLLKVGLFEREQEQVQELTSLTKQLDAKREALIAQAKHLDARWETHKTAGANEGLMPGLEEVYRLLSYYERWLAHLRERIVQLSM